MGAKTIKRLVILVVTIFVASLSIFLVQGFQVSRMNRSVLERAAVAEKKGEFDEAARLYQEHLAVTPDDQDVKLKYADVLLKGVKDANHQEQAAQLYGQLLVRFPGRSDIRRRLAELRVERGAYKDALHDLEFLLKDSQDGELHSKDGKLHFLMGRCLEGEDPAKAELSYQAAIDNGAPERVEAYERRANLLRGQLNRREEADRLIEEMVRSTPDDSRVLLTQARYRRRFAKTSDDLKVVADELQQVLKKSPKEPEAYLELATVAMANRNAQEARQILETGLKAVPDDPSLHERLADVELQAGSRDAAIARLRRSLQDLPDEVRLRWFLAKLLAEKGEKRRAASPDRRAAETQVSYPSLSNSSKPISRRTRTTGRRPDRPCSGSCNRPGSPGSFARPESPAQHPPGPVL